MKKEKSCPFCEKNFLTIEEHLFTKVIVNMMQTEKGAAYMVVPKSHKASIRELNWIQRISFFFRLFATYIKVVKKFKGYPLNILINEGEIAGQTVPHLHAHIFVREENDGVINMKREKRTPIKNGEIEKFRF